MGVTPRCRYGVAQRRYAGVMKRFLALLAVPAVVLAGCSSSGGESSAAPAPSVTVTSASPSSSPTAPTATTSTTSTTSTESMPRCHTADLSLTKGTGGAAAGTESMNLVFTNKSPHACTLYGYPGVSWVAGDNGTQVNAPFSREAGPGKKTITLAAGAVASALLLWPNSANFEASECKPAEVRGYRIYPPDEKASVFVDSPETVCSAKGVGLGRVQPIVKGAGQPG